MPCAHHRGGPEQLVYEQAPRPPLAIGDVLVRVHAASFTPTELGWPSTWTDRLGRERTPVTPAHELSGGGCRARLRHQRPTVGEEVDGLTDWYRDGAGGALVAVVGGTAVGPPRQDARWVFFVVEANRAGLPSQGAASTPASYGRSAGVAAGRGPPGVPGKQHGGLPGKAVLRVADQRHPAPPA
jgi:NADPH:quinone reductase-like Zn-dependent oxidoreductase